MPRRPRPPTSFADRFNSKVDQGTEWDDCHLWTGAKDEDGYGVVRLPGAGTRGAHIVSWEMASGQQLPTGWHVDHLCRIHACVNSDHLEAVPHAENVLRGESFSAKNARKTHCPQGHEYTDDNIRWHKSANGSYRRECKTCVRERDRARRTQQKEKTP